MEKYKIIIADDEEIQREFAKLSILETIKDKEFIFDEVSNGKDLVEKVKTNEYDIAITDNNMPFTDSDDGINATKEIREFNKELPIILVTGCHNFSFKLAEAKVAGINNGLSKPYNMEDLVELVKKYL